MNKKALLPMKGKYIPEKDMYEVKTVFSLMENMIPFSAWPEECYAGNWMIDCEGQYQVQGIPKRAKVGQKPVFSMLPSVPKSWERVYN